MAIKKINLAVQYTLFYLLSKSLTMNTQIKKQSVIHHHQHCNSISFIIRKLSHMVNFALHFSRLVAKYKIIGCSTLGLLLA